MSEPAEIVKPPNCICPRFTDTGGYRIADLACPIHGVGGPIRGDGPWEPDIRSIKGQPAAGMK